MKTKRSETRWTVDGPAASFGILTVPLSTSVNGVTQLSASSHAVPLSTLPPTRSIYPPLVTRSHVILVG